MSSTKKSIRLYEPTAGKIEFKGHDISGKLTSESRTLLRTKLMMIFQDRMASLNPRKTIGENHLIEGTHYVFGTDEEIAEWTAE